MKTGNIISRILTRTVLKIFPYGHGSVPSAPILSPDDVMLVSYPRSGNTWIRTILAYLLYDQDRIRSYHDINRLMPDVYYGIPRMVRYSSPRIVKTHQPFGFRHESNNQSLYQKNIYIVRHPFNVVQSFFQLQRELFHHPEESFEVFVRQFVSGTIPGNSSWREHVLSWKQAEETRKILFIRYEDIVSNEAEIIKKLADFLNKDVSVADIAMICDHTSRSAMNRLHESAPFLKKNQTLVREDQKNPREDVELTDELKQLICRHSRLAMELFGYSCE